MAAYQRKTLVPLADVGAPGDLPADLQGLADVSLADVTLAVGVDAATQLGYLNTGFFPVDAPDANVVTNTQLRIALNDAGLLDDMQNAVSSSPDPNDDIRFAYNSVFSIDDPMIVTAMNSVGIPRAAIFAAAHAVSP